MADHSLTVTFGCDGGQATCTWLMHHTHVIRGGSIKFVAESNTGGADVMNLPPCLHPNDNFQIPPGDAVILSVGSQAELGEYTFNWSVNSCTGDNEPPEFTVEE